MFVIFNDLITQDNINSKENRIYLMFNSRNGYTKIGRSINPKLREKTLQGEEPEIEMIAIFLLILTLQKLHFQ